MNTTTISPAAMGMSAINLFLRRHIAAIEIQGQIGTLTAGDLI